MRMFSVGLMVSIGGAAEDVELDQKVNELSTEFEAFVLERYPDAHVRQNHVMAGPEILKA